MSLADTIKADVAAVERDAETEAVKLFDAAKVDVRDQLPALIAKLGVDTSDGGNVLHAIVTVLVTLLEEYGPAEIRTVLKAVAPAVDATSVDAAQ